MEEQKSIITTTVTPKQQEKNLGPSALWTVIALSIIGGVIGAQIGLRYFPSWFKAPANVLGGAEQVNLSEDSAIIDVVKKDSPAVVSVVVSQDLSKIPGYGADPFNNNSDPFFNFFFGKQPQPTGPNVQQVAAGSGFFVSADGEILTNRHVVDNTSASYTVLTSDGKTYDATVLARDPVDDLAIIKINIKDAPFLKLADSNNLQVGQRVIAIGNSLGQYQNTVTSGIISGIGREITAGDSQGSESLEGVIQTDAAINPGNSGGPLLNILGEVVGINTAIDQQGQLVGFALPANLAATALSSYQKVGHISRPFLGVRYSIITQSIADRQKLAENYGALIIGGNNGEVGIVPGSPADKADLVENDIILSVNGTRVDENNSLSKILQQFKVGDMVNLEVYSKGTTKTVQVTLGEAK